MKNSEKFKVIDGKFYRLCRNCKEFILVNEINFHKEPKSSSGFSARCRKCTTTMPGNIKTYIKGGVTVEWTSEVEKLFKELYPIMSNKEIEKEFDITAATIKHLSSKLKIRKTSETRIKIQKECQTKNRRNEFYTSGGVRFFYRPNHPYCKGNGAMAEHRLVMEEKLGRYLLPFEGVHHKNGDKSDNSYDNLELVIMRRPEISPLDIYNDRENGMMIEDILVKYKIQSNTYYHKYNKGKAMSENTNNK